jgi:hypothetical protein
LLRIRLPLLTPMPVASISMKSTLVPLDGETLNELFEVFADWDEQLRHSDFPEMTLDDDEPQP